MAAVREQNPEPTIDAVRHALHEVVAKCIYGVDLNPMAVELAKVSLWMEAIEPGKPLGFLDAHIKHGNGLIGATPALLAKGIPDDAFKPIEGDDKKIASALKRRNATERGGQLSFHTEDRIWFSNTAFASSMRDITDTRVAELRDVRLQSSKFRELEKDAAYLQALHVADAWCAAFMWPKLQGAPTPVTEGVFRDLQTSDAGIPVTTSDEIIRLREQYRFFHWHLEFPEVFKVADTSATDVDPATGWADGFSCVLANPPWEHLELKEQEFFASRAVEIAEAEGARRKQLIVALSETNSTLHQAYEVAKREVDGMRHFASNSGSYPLCGRGRIKTDPVFAERSRVIIGPTGRLGAIVTTGIATDSNTQLFFRSITTSKSLLSLYDFRNAGFFQDVAGTQGNRFCLLSLQSEENHTPVDMVFRATDISELADPNRHVVLSVEEIDLLNPNTGTAPIIRSRRDADISVSVYRRLPVLIQEGNQNGNDWGISFSQGLFNMTSESSKFITTTQDGGEAQPSSFSKDSDQLLPLYEAKMLHHFNHRFGDYARVDLSTGKGVRALPRSMPTSLDDPYFSTEPRYWVHRSSVLEKLQAKELRRNWILGWRDVTSNLDERTMINSFAPIAGFGHKFPIVISEAPVWLIGATWSSFIFDYLTRLKVGGTSLSYFVVKQIPVPLPTQLGKHRPFIEARLLELVYTSHDMAGFAAELGDQGAPFRWNEERRQALRAELDALFFHLYGISREDADYVLDTFPIVRRKDEAMYGSYRTKELILADYDRMAAAGVSLENPLVEREKYTSTLIPLPGQGPRHRPGRSLARA